MSAPVAFIIPMYQAEQTIGSCLKSIMCQTYGDFESIIIDDGSTDNSPRIVEDVAKKDKRFRLVRTERNSGVAHALNVGLRETKREYIARLDSDDEAAPDRLRIQLEFMHSHPDVVVCGSYVTLIGKHMSSNQLGPKVPVTDENIHDQLKHTMHSPFYHPSVIFRRKVICDAGGYREFFRYSEDYDLWLRLERRHKFCNIPEELTRYRLSPAGVTLTSLRKQRLYGLLAKASYHEPHRDLEELWSEVISLQYGSEINERVRGGARYHVRKLAELGWHKEAVKVGLRSRRIRDLLTVYKRLLKQSLRRDLS